MWRNKTEVSHTGGERVHGYNSFVDNWIISSKDMVLIPYPAEDAYSLGPSTSASEEPITTLAHVHTKAWP